MKIEIFTEGSGTTGDLESVEQVKDYFKGNFLPVKDLANEISRTGDVTIHIFSDDHGYLLGSDSTSVLESPQGNRSKAEFKRSLTESSSAADITVILLTTTTFKDVVTSQWSDLVYNADQDSIWCIGASDSALSSVDIDELESSVRSAIIYKRVGVAPIDISAKQKLIDALTANI